MSVRKTMKAANYGNLVSYPNTDIVSFKRIYEKDSFLILANVRDKDIIYSVPSELVNSSWINALDHSNVQLNGQVSFKPYEFKILKNE